MLNWISLLPTPPPLSFPPPRHVASYSPAACLLRLCIPSMKHHTVAVAAAGARCQSLPNQPPLCPPGRPAQPLSLLPHPASLGYLGGVRHQHPARTFGHLLDPLHLRAQVSEVLSTQSPRQSHTCNTSGNPESQNSLREALRSTLPCPLQQVTGILSCSVPFSGWKLTDWLFRVGFTVVNPELVTGRSWLWVLLYHSLSEPRSSGSS